MFSVNLDVPVFIHFKLFLHFDILNLDAAVSDFLQLQLTAFS